MTVPSPDTYKYLPIRLGNTLKSQWRQGKAAGKAGRDWAKQIKDDAWARTTDAAVDTRILTVLPGAFDDPIRLHIDVVDVTQPSLPDFEALSYTWGPRELTREATVVPRGHDAGGVVRITRNLDTALRYVRRRDRPRVLWIDGVSINQADVEERNSQVKDMDKIFWNASKVVVFLGPEADGASEALGFLSTMGKTLSMHERKLEVAEGQEAPDFAVTKDRRVSEIRLGLDLATAIAKLIRRPWFSRIWVIQEVQQHRGEQSARNIAQCGHKTFNWPDFCVGLEVLSQAWRLIDNEDSRSAVGGSMPVLRGIIDGVGNQGPDTFGRASSVFEVAPKYDCDDPRDRVYGLLSLFNAALKKFVTVDYSLSVSAVYTDLQRTQIELEGLNLLIYCNFDGSSHSSHWEAPSWVPEPHMPLALPPRGPPAPTCRFGGCWTYAGDRGLRTQGSTLSVVDTARDMPPLDEAARGGTGAEPLQEWAQGFRDLVREVAGPDKYDAALDGIIDVLVGASMFWPKDATWAKVSKIWDGMLHSWRRFFEEGYLGEEKDYLPLALSPDEELLEDMWRARVLENLLHRLAIIATQDGHIGLATTFVQPGDRIAFLYGARAPLALRLASSSSSQGDGPEYRVVGPARIAGQTAAEQVLGPLPPHVRYLRHGWLDTACFLDTRAGAMVQDPRLAGLGLDAAALVRKPPAGMDGGAPDDLMRPGDIQMSSAQLEKAGLPVEEFILV